MGFLHTCQKCPQLCFPSVLAHHEKRLPFCAALLKDRKHPFLQSHKGLHLLPCCLKFSLISLSQTQARSHSSISLIGLKKSELIQDALEISHTVIATESSSARQVLFLLYFREGILMCSPACPLPPGCWGCKHMSVTTSHNKWYLVRVTTRHWSTDHTRCHPDIYLSQSDKRSKFSAYSYLTVLIYIDWYITWLKIAIRPHLNTIF